MIPMKDPAVASHAMSVLAKLFGSDTIKGTLVTLILGAVGVAWHSSVQLDQQEVQLKQQADAISTLNAKADDRDLAITDLKITLSRIDGKIDVLAAKIDDDRRRHQ
jgi:hypothetical protein